MVLCERTKIKQRGKVVGSTNIQHEFGGGENPTLKQKTEQERNTFPIIRVLKWEIIRMQFTVSLRKDPSMLF